MSSMLRTMRRSPSYTGPDPWKRKEPKLRGFFGLGPFGVTEVTRIDRTKQRGKWRAMLAAMLAVLAAPVRSFKSRRGR